jgi:aspartyl-tRNA(Asn)/glutamyl-tRNA(Gln) amidotransferase subunit A
MNDTPVGVTAIATAVADGVVSAAEVVADYLKRAERTQKTINAFTLIERDAATAAAAKIDRRLAAGEGAGPLAGVPVAIKDLIDHAGRPNTAGSNYPAPVPDETSPVVSRLEGAGAIIIGRTGLHEYAFGFSSENHWFGPVRNPWDPSLSPGGSSGGSGAAVAAGAAAAALGTDTGGSVRVPAALCGVVGLKVTHGRVPLTGVFPLAPSLDTVGPLARTIGDASAIYQVIAGFDRTDPWSAPRPVHALQGPLAVADLTLGVPHPWVDLRQTEPIAASFAATIDAVRRAGARIIDLDLPDLVPGPQIEASVYPEVALIHDERWHAHPETYGPDVSQRLGEVFDIDSTRYIAAHEWRARIRHDIEASLRECDFLMTPAVAANAKPIGEEMIDVAGKSVSYRPYLSRYSALVNHAGLPAIVLPLDMDGAPPPSVQFIARPWDEHRLLEMGLALEQHGISRWRHPSLFPK